MRILASIVMVAAGVWLAATGNLYQTGAQWFDACWSLRSAVLSEGQAAIAPDATTAAAWHTCQPVAEEAFIATGVQQASPGEVAPGALKITCRSRASEVPITRLDFVVVKIIEGDGGPGFFDRVLPASSTASAALHSGLSGCAMKGDIADLLGVKNARLSAANIAADTF
jgi:hypothetical protein